VSKAERSLVCAVPRWSGFAPRARVRMVLKSITGTKRLRRAALMLSAAITVNALAVLPATATDVEIDGLSITRIRAVGDYQGTTYDNTVELWFSAPLVWPAGSPCTVTYRVEVDAANKHVVAAAYMAVAAGKKVNINVDDTLPIRNGTCQVSFLDVMN